MGFIWEFLMSYELASYRCFGDFPLRVLKNSDEEDLFGLIGFRRLV